MKYLLTLGIAATFAGVASAQTLLSPNPANNGSGGIYFDVTPVGLALDMTGFDVAFTGTVGTAVSLEVWTRPGSYVGFEASSAGWTLSATATAVRGGTAVFVPLVMSNDVAVAAGGTTGFLLHCITSGGGVRYGGTTAAPAITAWGNADMNVFSAHSRTGNIPFGTTITPRAFAGSMHYEVVPEPGTFVAIGIGLAGLALARRRK